jgi:long-chain acyl-CoA synthetase
MSYTPIPQKFLDAVDHFNQQRAQLWRTAQGWQAISAREMLRRVAALSRALYELGIQPGDRVGLFAANRPEWHIADFAILGLGAADVPVYFRESAERLVYILNHSGARAVFVAGGEQAEKLMECRAQLPHVEHIIVADAETDFGSEALRYETLIAGAEHLSANDGPRVEIEDVRAYRERAAKVTSEMLATIIYTSGTTGEPKGVMLTQNNLASNAEDALGLADYSPADTALSFLPLAHVYERTLDYVFFFRGVSIAYLDVPEHAAQTLLEVKPTIAGAVPRVFEKLYAAVIAKGHQESGVKRKIFDWAIRIAPQFTEWRTHGVDPGVFLKLKWQIANKLVYAKIRAGLGGRVKEFISGGAPLSKELAEFFWAIDVPILQGYGLTETSPVISVNNHQMNRLGTVGPPIPHVAVKIATDGEILTRGPHVMAGYYKKPEETAAVISSDGWFATGDIGFLDKDSYLTITDRKKDLFKTAGGKFVAPQIIENALKLSPYISAAAIVGDRRKFICALIVPDFSAVTAAAKGRDIQFASQADLAKSPWVRELIGGEVEKVNSHLAQYETVKRFAILDADFSFESGELTYTMKLKRRVIEDRYEKQIRQLYADVEEPRPIAASD